jgi:hypothetical protein
MHYTFPEQDHSIHGRLCKGKKRWDYMVMSAGRPGFSRKRDKEIYPGGKFEVVDFG